VAHVKKECRNKNDKIYFYKIFNKSEVLMMILIKASLTGLVGVSLSMANISGIVTDTGTTPISGGVVQLEKGGQTATTGTDGRFTLVVSTAILSGKSKSLPNDLSAMISGNLLNVTIAERAAIEVATFDLNGKALSLIRQTINAGTHNIALPYRGAGVYLYKVKAGDNEFVLKGNAVGGISYGSAVSSQGSSSNSMAKQAMSTVAINDVIAATKSGYLNYRVVVTNSDTSGITINMIVCADTVRDIDGNLYQAVRIGNQVWMAENLRVTRYNDRSVIPKITSHATWDSCYYTFTPAYCYYNNTTNADSIKKFGALYNWYAVNTGKLAPAGWHVPTDSEWTVMEKYLVLNGYNWDGTKDASQGNNIAKALAAKTDWCTDTTTGTIGNDLTMNNSSGFSALPGGYRYYNGYFLYQSNNGNWWSATEFTPSYAYYRFLFFANYLLSRSYDLQGCGFAVRLVRD
jgi:uncharacterized protein (TIGR02145 family)